MEDSSDSEADSEADIGADSDLESGLKSMKNFDDLEVVDTISAKI